MVQLERVCGNRTEDLIDVEHEAHLYRLAALFIVLAVLGCFVALLFITVESLDQPLTPLSSVSRENQAISSSGSGLTRSSLPPLVATNNSAVAVVAELDNDLDNDGSYDALADPLAVLALGAAVLEIAVTLVALAVIELLLLLCEPLKLSFFWPEVLESPAKL